MDRPDIIVENLLHILEEKKLGCVRLDHIIHDLFELAQHNRALALAPANPSCTHRGAVVMHGR